MFRIQSNFPVHAPSTFAQNLFSSVFGTFTKIAAVALAAISAFSLVFVFYQKYQTHIKHQATLLAQKQLEEEEKKKKLQEDEEAALKFQREEWGDEDEQINDPSKVGNAQPSFKPIVPTQNKPQNTWQDNWNLRGKDDSLSSPINTDEDKKRKEKEEEESLRYALQLYREEEEIENAILLFNTISQSDTDTTSQLNTDTTPQSDTGTTSQLNTDTTSQSDTATPLQSNTGTTLQSETDTTPQLNTGATTQSNTGTTQQNDQKKNSPTVSSQQDTNQTTDVNNKKLSDNLTDKDIEHMKRISLTSDPLTDIDVSPISTDDPLKTPSNINGNGETALDMTDPSPKTEQTKNDLQDTNTDDNLVSSDTDTTNQKDSGDSRTTQSISPISVLASTTATALIVSSVANNIFNSFKKSGSPTQSTFGSPTQLTKTIDKNISTATQTISKNSSPSIQNIDQDTSTPTQNISKDANPSKQTSVKVQNEITLSLLMHKNNIEVGIQNFQEWDNLYRDQIREILKNEGLWEVAHFEMKVDDTQYLNLIDERTLDTFMQMYYNIYKYI